ncbi:hypothetical protein Back11_40150 [Paenibacillus baekrokdamisoli]|uniref:DUF58 domain-containing protein n=1 Tax=Paenibacillus baekrokdamisoli TaxID=1712516 RepID=A0A3G9IV49_9BACL|nr:hypothetical protein Back11_40150 [Paenibacillus baekrokdamisoli]
MLGNNSQIGKSGTITDKVNRVETDTKKSSMYKNSGKRIKAAARELNAAGVNTAEASKLHSRYFARIVLIVLLAASAAAEYARGGAVEWFFLAMMTAVFLCVCMVPYAAAGRISVERIIEEERLLVDGGQMMVQVFVRLSRPLPLMWLGVSEGIANLTIPQNAVVPYRTVTVPGFSRVLMFRYMVTGLQRGELDFQPIRISIGDLLGMTVRTLELSCASSVLVKPQPPAGEHWKGFPGAIPGVNASNDRPVASASGLTLTAAARVSRDGMGPEVRTYTPGDPLRRIDWRAMARGLGMQTRISNAEQPSEVIILLEASQKAYGKEMRLFDANVGRAAMALRRAFEQGKGVEILSNSLEEERVTVRAGDKAALRLAEDKLARIQANGVKLLFDSLAGIVGQMPRGAAIICLAVGHASTEGTIEAGSIRPDFGRMNNGDGTELQSVAYGAKLAGIRGVRLYLLLAYGGGVMESQQREREWQERLSGTGCFVKGMPVPAAYQDNHPTAMEGGRVDVSASIS